MRAAAVVLVLLAVGAAHADPAPKARADALFDKGQAHYQAGEYQAAIESFLSAYELVHDPVYLFNIAQSYRKIANCVGAYDYYARYLAEAKDAPNRDKVSGWLRELEPCADKTRAEHDAAVKAAEEDRQRKAAAEHGVVPAPSTPVPMAAGDRGRTYRLAGIATASAGVIGLVVGVGFAAHGSSLHDQITAQCGSMPCSWDMPNPPATQSPKSLDDAGNRANKIAWVTGVAGGLAVIAGAGLYYYGHTRVEVSVTPTAAVVGARIHF